MSGNALRHGVLSQRLVLGNENARAFRALFDDLVASLNPVGAMELTLVEKIATNLWRQKRLVGAESASIELQCRPENIATAVSSVVFGALSPKRITPSELERGPEAEEIQWCRDVVREFDAVPRGGIDNWSDLERLAPLMYNQLVEDAEEDEQPIGEFLAEYAGGLSGYLEEILRYCHDRIRDDERHPTLLRIAEWVSAKKSILGGESGERLSRYQTTLDNELYKALKALRDAQQWRMGTIEGAVAPAVI